MLVLALLAVAACAGGEAEPAPSNSQPTAATEAPTIGPVTASTAPSTQTGSTQGASPAAVTCEPLDETASDVQRLIGLAAEVQRLERLDRSLSADEEARLEDEMSVTASAAFDGACEPDVLDLCNRIELECVVAIRDGKEFELSLEGFIGNVLLEVDSDSVRVTR